MNNPAFPRNHRRAFSLLTACLIGLSALTARANFSENFDNPSSPSVNLSTSDIGWTAYHGSTATDISNATASGVTRAIIAGAPGNPSGTNGFLSLSATGSATNFAVIKTGLNIVGPSEITWNVARAFWDQDHNPTTRLLVQIGGNWFVSSTAFSMTQKTSAADFQNAQASEIEKTLTFSHAATAWHGFTLAPGSSMGFTAGALAADLPSGIITGIGLYTENVAAGGAVRIDTLHVTTSNIPEPSTYAILVGLGCLTAVVFLKRRTSTGR